MYNGFLKRFFDIIFSLLLQPIFALIIIIFGPIIYFEDKGKIFYNAKRLGKNGKVFKMYKFRTMKENSPDLRNSDGSTYNSEDDPRLTRIGKFLRKTSIDEIPQILNIIKGDMSFIGPRPDLVEALDIYDNNEKRKLNIRPGISGYNQAFFRNSISVKKRFKNDLYYLDNLCFLLDVKILIKTIQTILKKENVYIKDSNENS